jgi:hypothetical protein
VLGQKNSFVAGGMAQAVECLSSKIEALSSNLKTTKKNQKTPAIITIITPPKVPFYSLSSTEDIQVHVYLSIFHF